MLLSELTASARRLALVGLAKNTGKTVALAALLDELRERGTPVGVTSVGRDGEEHDVIDFRIAKPPVRLVAGSLVATTDSLLSASGVPHERLQNTGVRTPLGEVLIARMRGEGTIEVAGPSASSEVRGVADAMLSLGAEQVLIDGAIDRRAASSPAVSDGLVMCTGAVLSEDIEEVVRKTVQAVELVRLPAVPDTERERLQDIAKRHRGGRRALLLDDDGELLAELPARFVLTASGQEIETQLAEHPNSRTLLVSGALPETFAAELTRVLRRKRIELEVIVGDPTHAFLSERGPGYYALAGLRLRTLRVTELMALTVNPVAPQSHSFESGRLRTLLAEAIHDVAIIDVMHAEHLGTRTEPPRRLI